MGQRLGGSCLGATRRPLPTGRARCWPADARRGPATMVGDLSLTSGRAPCAAPTQRYQSIASTLSGRPGWHARSGRVIALRAVVDRAAADRALRGRRGTQRCRTRLRPGCGLEARPSHLPDLRRDRHLVTTCKAEGRAGRLGHRPACGGRAQDQSGRGRDYLPVGQLPSCPDDGDCAKRLADLPSRAPGRVARQPATLSTSRCRYTG